MIYIIAILIVVIVIWRLISGPNAEEVDTYKGACEFDELEQELRDHALKINDEFNSLSELYGNLSAKIVLDDESSLDINKMILVYEESEVVILESKKYSFADILDFQIIDNETKQTIATTSGANSASNGSVFGRALVGGALMGGLGAVAGATTAKRNVSENTTSTTHTNHSYTLYVSVNNFQEPVISIWLGNNTVKTQQVASVFKIIEHRRNEKQTLLQNE